MSGKVVPLPVDTTRIDGGARKGGRRSHVFKAVNDVYEFNGWSRIWLCCLWFVMASVTVSYRYPATAGTFHSSVKALMAMYDDMDGNTADVRSQSTFHGGLSHALGFLKVYAEKAEANHFPDETLPITEYDKIVFARLEVELKPNCLKVYKRLGLSCYKSGIDPRLSDYMDQDALEQMRNGHREIELLNPNVTREELLARVQKIMDTELLALSKYAFRASLLIGVVNEMAEHYLTVYYFVVSRKSNDAIGSQSMRGVVTLIDNVDVRDTPFYINSDDYRRAVLEVLSLFFLMKAIWEEVLQFHMCRAWRNLNLTEEQRQASGWKRTTHLLWFFFAQPWNILDFITIVNFIAWWIFYAVLLAKGFQVKVKTVHTLQDFDEAKSLAELQVPHLVWGIFTSLLVGLRVLAHFKTHSGLGIYSLTLKLSWHRLKDLAMFFGYVYFLIVVLISPLFELTGANVLFRDTGTGILNMALMTFQYMGFSEFFAYNAPTFGTYWLIFMFFFWVVVVLLVVISQNVLLALVAGAYEEAREVVGHVEFTELQLSLYRLWWIGYSRWHMWLLRKSRYALAEELMEATSKPDVWFYQHLFVRWALADLPEMRLLAQLYTDPASEILYMYSPWAWHRSSPWDMDQQAPWDEQLDYPMYSWEDVPMNEPGMRPRLRRMPPLFSQNPPGGCSVARGRLPTTYSEADDLFAMSEEEVDDLLECAEFCWSRIRRYPIIARFGDMDWSEQGHKLVRQGLLEVYRRHLVKESTSTTVGGPGFNGGYNSGTGKAMLLAVDDQPYTPAIKTTGGSSAPMGIGARGGSGDTDNAAANGGESDSVPAALARNRHFSLFNRRGRIAENLDLLWGEISEVRQQQAEIKMLLAQLLRQQQQPKQLPHQQSPITAATGSIGGPGSVSGGGGGGSSGGNGGVNTMRGTATLPSEPPQSGGASRSRGPWE